MIFVDTSAWYAFFTRKDVNYGTANRLLVSFEEPLVTTDYVVDETLTLFRSRGETRHALTFGRRVIERRFAEIIMICK